MSMFKDYLILFTLTLGLLLVLDRLPGWVSVAVFCACCLGLVGAGAREAVRD